MTTHPPVGARRPAVAARPTRRPRRPRRSRPALAAAFAVLALVVPAVLGVVAAAPAEARTAAVTVVTPEKYGANGLDARDDSVALQRALDALGPGRRLVLPSGRTYRHDRVLQLRRPDAWVSGPGTLLATDETQASLHVTGARALLDNGLRVVMLSSTQRWIVGHQTDMVWLDHTVGSTLRSVRVDGSPAVGIVVDGATGAGLVDVDVRNTRADGIHVVNGSRDVYLTRPVTTNTGDDGVSVVSYAVQPVVSDVRIYEPSVNGVLAGRGVAVVGGEDVLVRNPQVRDTAAAGIYLAAEDVPGMWVTHPTRRVQVTGGSVTRANREGSIAHGAILVASSVPGESVSDVLVSGTSVVATPDSQYWQVGVIPQPGAWVRGVRLEGLTLDQEAPLPLYAPSDGQVTATGWTVAGAPWSPG